MNELKKISVIAVLLLATGIAVGQSNSGSSNQQSTGTVSNSQAGASSATNSTSTTFIPAGTTLAVRINDNLSSETTQEGSQFTGTLAADLTTSDGRVIFPRGADVAGRVITAKASGRLSESGELDLSVDSIRSGSQSVDVRVTPFAVKGQSHTKSNTTKIGGGAALGAIIGAIAGGGKGAAIGAGVGAGAGGAGAAATGKQPATVEAEAVLQFVTSTGATINGASRSGSAPYGTNSTSNSSGNDGLRHHTDGPYAGGTDPRTQDGRTRRADYNANAAGNRDSTYSNSTSTNNAPDVRSFSARDRRVMNTCFADNPGSFRSDQTGTNSYSDQPVKDQTLPYSIQNKARSLPLACDRQLMPLPNNLERVYYNNQVILLDGSNRVLDMFTINTP